MLGVFGLVYGANGVEGNTGSLGVIYVGSPFMLALELARRYQCGQFYDFGIQTRFEAHVASQVRGATGKLGAVQKRQKRTTHRPAALRNRIVNRLVLGRQI